MMVDKVESFATITVCSKEIMLLIHAINRVQTDYINDPDYKRLENEFKSLFKRMTGREFGVR